MREKLKNQLKARREAVNEEGLENQIKEEARLKRNKKRRLAYAKRRINERGQT